VSARDQDGSDLNAPQEDRLPWLEQVEPSGTEGKGTPKALLTLLGAAAIAAAITAAAIFWGASPQQIDNTELVAGTGQDGAPLNRSVASSAGGSQTAAAERSDGKAERKIRSAPQRDRPERRKASSPIKANPEAGDSGRAAQGTAPKARAAQEVQLGAFSTRHAANRAWRLIAREKAAVEHRVTKAIVGGRTFYRLRATGSGAWALCRKLQKSKRDCIVIKR
jgi:hypothetical protein